MLLLMLLMLISTDLTVVAAGIPPQKNLYQQLYTRYTVSE
jgi:hypothetical protein